MGLAQLFMEHRAAKKGQLRQPAAAIRGVGGIGRRHDQGAVRSQRFDPAPGETCRHRDHTVADARLIKRCTQHLGCHRRHLKRPVRRRQLMVARAVRGHVDHQHIVLTVHACGQGRNGALQVLGRCPRVGLRSVGMVEQVQHPPLGVKPLLQQRADHAAFAAEHVFICIGGKHQPVDIRHARALWRQGLHLLLPQQLLVFKQAL